MQTLINKKGASILLLVILTAVVYANSAFFDFVWDDNALIVGNDAYENFRLDKILFSFSVNGLEYLPVRDITYAIDYFIWGENPAGFHLSNIFFYLVNIVLAYLTTIKLTRLLQTGNSTSQQHIAFFTSLLFAIHPLHSEPVSFLMGGRNTLLSGMFFFAACYSYLLYMEKEGSARKQYYVIALVSYVLALFSKAIAIIFPAVLLVFHLLRNKLKFKDLSATLPFFLVSFGGFALFKAVAQHAGVINEDRFIVYGALKFLPKLAVSLQIPFFYLYKMLLPINLSAGYNVTFQRELLNPTTLLSFIALTGAVAGGAYLMKKSRVMIFSVLWFLICLLPVMNFFNTQPVVADRYVYLASYAIHFLLVAGIYRLTEKRLRKLGVISLISLALFWSVTTIERNRVWQSDKTLYSETIKTSPNSATFYKNLAVIHFKEGNYDSAFELFDKLERLAPSNIAPEYHRSVIDLRQGKFKEVIKTLEEALLTKVGDTNTYYLLGQAYEAVGDEKKAIKNYLDAIDIKEADVIRLKPEARRRVEVLQASAREGLDVLRQKARAYPDDINVRAELAIALDELGLHDEALNNYLDLERRNALHWGLYFNIGNIYKKMNKYEPAVTYYLKSLDLKNNNAIVLNNLGLVYTKLEDYDSAIRAFKQAMQADKDYQNAPFNLAVLYFKIGDRQNARYYFDYIERTFPDLKGFTSAYKGL